MKALLARLWNQPDLITAKYQEDWKTRDRLEHLLILHI